MKATANGEHERLVEEIVREILDAHPNRDAAEADLKGLGSVELADEFLDARELLRRLYNKADALGWSGRQSTWTPSGE